MSGIEKFGLLCFGAAVFIAVASVVISAGLVGTSGLLFFA